MYIKHCPLAPTWPRVPVNRSYVSSSFVSMRSTKILSDINHLLHCTSPISGVVWSATRAYTHSKYLHEPQWHLTQGIFCHPWSILFCCPRARVLKSVANPRGSHGNRLVFIFLCSWNRIAVDNAMLALIAHKQISMLSLPLLKILGSNHSRRNCSLGGCSLIRP